MIASPGEITALLGAVRTGDAKARDQLIKLVYTELHDVAAGFMYQERDNHTLQPTALLHEAFVRLFSADVLRKVPNRAYLFGAAARLMREVLADHARRRAASRRGGNFQRVPLDDIIDASEEQNQCSTLALHEALDQMATFHERQSLVVTLRFFGGFSVQEVAEQLNVSVATVENDFRIARAWLWKQLKGDEA
jgi:RNA polymerase sigma factor (TIGR02999 family)